MHNVLIMKNVFHVFQDTNHLMINLSVFNVPQLTVDLQKLNRVMSNPMKKMKMGILHKQVSRIRMRMFRNRKMAKMMIFRKTVTLTLIILFNKMLLGTIQPTAQNHRTSAAKSPNPHPPPLSPKRTTQQSLKTTKLI